MRLNYHTKQIIIGIASCAALIILTGLITLLLTGCQPPPYPGGYYPARPPSDQMLEVGQTLMRADRGYR